AQAALLRFLDDQLVRPVGGHHLRKVNVQLLAATHADLQAEVAARRFRADLYYRLDTVAVQLPPLRARSDFDAVVGQVLGRLDNQAQLDAEALALLRQQPWPGNFRELRAVLTRALLRCHHPHVDARAVALSLNQADSAQPAGGRARAARPTVAVSSASEPIRVAPAGVRTGQTGEPPRRHAGLPMAASSAAQATSALQHGATSAVLAEYRRSGGSVSATSRTLGISRTTVYRHLRLAEAI
ncbi:MAG: hypothetical protein RLZZ584_4317, partial [Pseudomonadota bacterium]